MKKQMLTTLMVLTLAAPAMAMDHGKMSSGTDHSKMSAQGDKDHGKMTGDMDHSDHKGEMIHESTVDGYQLAYHLIDMKEHMEAMKDMPGMASMKGMDMSQMKSHHLMLYIADSSSKNVAEGKIGYKVTGPDGADQKTMAMAMTGGFGADVDLKAKGTYTIKTKAVVGEAKLIDEFSYEVK